MYNEQAERSTKAGMQLLKEATRVMLAVPAAATIGVLARFALAQYQAGPLYGAERPPDPPNDAN